jgi:nicotinamide mononucleotide transporter
MSWAEILGFVTGAASVGLYARQRIEAWPLGIANSVFWLVLFWRTKLYLDSGLQGVYVVLGVAGWYWWARGGTGRRELAVRRAEPVEVLGLAMLGVFASGILWWAEAHFTNSTLPFWDAWTTVLSLIAQLMLTRKLFGNWWCWIAVDVAYVGMYLHLHLFLTAALQPVFIALCLAGVRDWRRSIEVVPA